MIVEVTVKRVISDEQLELRSRLEVLDRKVTAILRDAFERRRLHDDVDTFEVRYEPSKLTLTSRGVLVPSCQALPAAYIS